MEPFDLESVIPWRKVALWSLVAAGVVVLGAVVTSAHFQRQYTTAIQAADEAHGRTDAAIESARRADAAAQTQASANAEQAKDVAKAKLETSKAKAELARVLVQIHQTNPVIPPVSGSGNAASVAVDTHAELISAQAVVIEKQEKEIAAQDGQIQGLTRSLASMTQARDAWKRTSEEGGREALQLRAALAAQEGLTKGALWKGRIQGFVVGLGSGYVGGRLR